MKSVDRTIQNSAAVATIQAENDSLKKQLADSEKQLAQAREKIIWWEEQYKLSRQRRFGKSSEKCPGQSSLFDEIEMPEVAEDTEVEKETISYTRKKKSKGRNIDTSKLQREICVHALSDEEKQCECCGGEMQEVGEDKTEKLVYIPETIKVVEHIYPKYACRPCETIKMPKRELGPIPKSMATSSLIAEIIVSKYERHIPLYRRSQIFARNGIDIPDNTLGNWVMQACDALASLGEALWEQINCSHYLQVDETPVKVLDKDKKGYMWCYHNPSPDNRFVLFDYHLSRGSEVPKARLVNFQGILQTDGYSGYNSLRRRNDIINAGCMAHCRRKFKDAWKIGGNTAKGLASKFIRIVARLYRIEDEIENFTPDEKKAHRQKQAKPLLTQLHQWLVENQSSVLPKSQLGGAFTYAINQWDQIIAYLDHGEVNIDNNWVENQIRPFALGRRNWLFVGNERGGHAAALLYSLIQTCKINNINARTYFEYVLDQTHKLRRGETDAKSLLPQFIDPTILK